MSENPQNAIFRVLQQIPPGKVVSYGQVATMAGLGRAARFVGTTLRKLPKDTKLPWHRVVNSQGRISFKDDHPGFKRQKERLESEGVHFIRGRINFQHYQWQPDA